MYRKRADNRYCNINMSTKGKAVQNMCSESGNVFHAILLSPSTYKHRKHEQSQTELWRGMTHTKTPHQHDCSDYNMNLRNVVNIFVHTRKWMKAERR